MKKETIIIQIATNSTDSEGFVGQNWIDAITIKAVVAPCGQDLAIKEYGYNAPVKYKIINIGRNNQFMVVGNKVLFCGLEMYIVYLANYGKVQDMLVNTEIFAGGK